MTSSRVGSRLFHYGKNQLFCLGWVPRFLFAFSVDLVKIRFCSKIQTSSPGGADFIIFGNLTKMLTISLSWPDYQLPEIIKSVPPGLEV